MSMATHEVDQKLLGLLAKSQLRRNTKLAGALYQILGLSIMLGPRLVTARRLRDNDLASMEVTKKRRLLEEIVWLTRAGLELLQEHVNPSINNRSDPRLRIFAAKLRASFYHVFCLFRNDPPLTELARSVLESYQSEARRNPLTPRNGSRSSPHRNSGSKGKGRMYDKENESKSSPPNRANLRDSMISEASYVTNPWSPPPGLPLPELTGPDSADFLIPTRDYMPAANGAFREASTLAEKLLPASAPLRLSVQLERCAFLWDCAHDHGGSRKLARTTIRDVYRTDAGLTDEEFEDSTQIVGTLGRMMRRKSQEGTPRFGSATPLAPRSAHSGPSTTPRDAPPVPQIPTSAPQTRTRQQPPADPGNIGQLAQDVAESSSRPRTTTRKSTPRTSTPQRTSQIPQRSDSIQRTPSPHRQARTQRQRQLPPRSSPPQAPLPQPPQVHPQTPPRRSPAGSSSAGTSFLVPRKPIPPQAQGSTASPGRSMSGRTGTTQTASPGGSTAPTAMSTPRARGSPREAGSQRQAEQHGRASKRPGSDSGSPSRKQRSRR